MCKTGKKTFINLTKLKIPQRVKIQDTNWEKILTTFTTPIIHKKTAFWNEKKNFQTSKKKINQFTF